MTDNWSLSPPHSIKCDRPAEQWPILINEWQCYLRNLSYRVGHRDHSVHYTALIVDEISVTMFREVIDLDVFE